MNNFSFNVIEIGKGDITNFLDALNRGLRDLGRHGGGGSRGANGGASSSSSGSAFLASQGFALSQSDALEPSSTAGTAGAAKSDATGAAAGGIAIPAHDQVIGAGEGMIGGYGGNGDDGGDDDDDDDDDGMDFLAGDGKALLEQAANEAVKAGEAKPEDADLVVAQGPRVA